MGVVQESLPERVERMDVHLKAFFKDQQSFISHGLQGLEKRPGGRIDDLAGRSAAVEGRLDKVEHRLDTLETNMKLGFRLMDARFTRIDRQLAEIRRDLKMLVKASRARSRRAQEST